MYFAMFIVCLYTYKIKSGYADGGVGVGGWGGGRRGSGSKGKRLRDTEKH
jgi:hypothetical protein